MRPSTLRRSLLFAGCIAALTAIAPATAAAESCAYNPATKAVTATITPGSQATLKINAAGTLLFGNVPIVKNNFSFVALGIVVVSLLPMVVEFVKYRGARAR